jgi:hypothetical protein
VRKTTLPSAPEEAIRLLGSPSPDHLNALSPTPPLEMAGPPLRLQPRRRLRLSPCSHLVPGSCAKPGRSTLACEDVLPSRRDPHGEVSRRPTFSLAMGRPRATAPLRWLRAAGRNSPSCPRSVLTVNFCQPSHEFTFNVGIDLLF